MADGIDAHDVLWSTTSYLEDKQRLPKQKEQSCDLLPRTILGETCVWSYFLHLPVVIVAHTNSSQPFTCEIDGYLPSKAGQYSGSFASVGSL